MPKELKNYEPALKYGANLGVQVDLTDITDQNNNEVIELDGVTSAVNYLGIANAATGTATVMEARGDDTNVDLQLDGKGTAVVLIGDWGTAQVSQVAAGAGAAITINTQKGSITIPDFDISSGSAFLVNLTNNKLYDTDNPRMLLTSIGRGGNTINSALATQVDVGAGSATITVISGTTTAQDGSIVVNFLVI